MACVIPRPLDRPKESDLYTGRPSEPAFQDMNLEAVRCNYDEGNDSDNKNECDSSEPRAVVWQSSSDDPLDPRTLLMAYEEHSHVTPVVSDFDCFIVGTRNIEYDTPLPPEQVDLMRWSVSQAESILDCSKKDPSGVPWTGRWLEVLKRAASEGNSAYKTPIPRLGFGDSTSYSIMEHAVTRTKCGAVRHGAECFNYKFPQEIDDEFLVISDTLPRPVPWKYVTERELRDLLSQKIDEGFTFPLNPKWVLCDRGWRKVYDKLLASEHKNVRRSMEIWFPPESGIREHVNEVCRRHPNGFYSEKNKRFSMINGKTLQNGAQKEISTEAMDLAELQLRRYMIRRSAKVKLRAALLMRGMGSRNLMKGVRDSNRK